MKDMSAFIDSAYHRIKAIKLQENPAVYFEAVSLDKIPKSYIVINIETVTSIPSETRSFLSRGVLKLYLRGYYRFEYAQEISRHLDGEILSDFKLSVLGYNIVDNDSLSLRISFI